VVDACEASGIDTEPILAKADISHAVMEDAEGRVSLDQMRTFWSEAVAQSREPAIGLKAAVRVPHGQYGLYDYIAAYSDTVGEAFTRFAEYLPLINNWILMKTDVNDHAGRISMSTVWGATPRMSAEYVAGLLTTRARRDWNAAIRPHVIFEFPQPEFPERPDLHEVALGCPVTFGGSTTEIVLDRASWDLPVENGDGGLAAMLVRQADQQLDQLPRATPFVQEVRHEVQAGMVGGDQQISVIADRLGMSARTLQRKLGADGLTFAEIVDEVRLEAAKAALADHGVSLAEVAFLVGFEEQSSFSRAFKRWTGSSPRDFRSATLSTD